MTFIRLEKQTVKIFTSTTKDSRGTESVRMYERPKTVVMAMRHEMFYVFRS